MVVNQLRKSSHLFVVFFVVCLSVVFPTSHICAELIDYSAEEYRSRGYEEQIKGNLTTALTFYSKAVSLGLSNAVVFNDIGVVYEQLGSPRKAEEFYLKAMKLDPNYQAPYTNLAYLFLEEGDIPNAIFYFHERLNRASEIDPWVIKIKTELSKIDPDYKKRLIQEELEAKGRQLRKKALEDFCLKIIRSEKHFQKGQQLVKEKKFGEAIQEFDLALSVTPDNPKIMKTKEHAVYLKQIDEIRQRAERAIEKLRLGEIETAKKEFQEILTIIPKEPIQNP